MFNNSFFGREINRVLQSNSMANKIILVNVLVFVFTSLFYLLTLIPGVSIATDLLERTLGMPAQFGLLIYKPWTLITDLFIHGSIWHLLGNMLLYYWFARVIEEFIGSKKVLPLFILGGLAGNIAYLLSANLIPVLHAGMYNSYVIGASGAVMATVVAAATLVPNYTFMLPFLGPIKIAWIAFFYVMLDVLALPAMGSGLSDGVGHFAHIGGALFGFVFIKQLQQGNDWSSGFNKMIDWFANLFSRRGPKLSYTSSANKKKNQTNNNRVDATAQQKKLDGILDKISQSGYEGLTAEEKEFLFRYSKKN